MWPTRCSAGGAPRASSASSFPCGADTAIGGKWLASGGALTLIVLAVSFGISSTNAAGEVLGIGLAALPVGIGVGILKYRLYDIDRIISRAVSYAIVTGLLVRLYTGLVLLATQVMTVKSPVAVAGSTLVAAALFSPLRRRVQRVVDKRFNRVRYNADRTVAAFAARLRGAVDLDTVRADLLAVVNSAVEPAHISVWTAADGPGPPAQRRAQGNNRIGGLE